MMFFHLSLHIHHHDLQHHQSLPKTMFHLQAKQLHASFVLAHFHLKDAADVIIVHIAAPCLHPSPSPKQSLYKKPLNTMIHLHHHLPDLWHLQLDLQFELHLSNLLPGLTSHLILQRRVQTLKMSNLHAAHLALLTIILPLSLLQSEENPSNDQPLHNRLKNLRLLSYLTLTTPMSIKLHQRIPMPPRTKSIEKTPHQSQVRHPMQLTPDTIPKLPSFNTLELQARVIMSKACDPSISPSAFNEYLLKHDFQVWNAKEIEDSKPYRMLCIFGPLNVGKSSAAGGMNTYVRGVQVTTTSKKFYKYINETTNSNLYHFCNDSFSSPSGINWDRLLQSINSITHGVGRHFVVVEGHRLFECDTLLDDTDYIVILTALPSTLRCRPEPTEEQSLQLYISGVQNPLQALNDSKGIMKINGISSPEIVIKKIGAFFALKNKGLQNCGKRLSDTRLLLEVSTTE